MSDCGIDAGWQDAQRVMPEGWTLVTLSGGQGSGWTAIAEPTPAYEPGYLEHYGPTVRWLGRSAHADTPGGAVVALAAKLRRGGE